MRIAVYANDTSQLKNAREYFKKWKREDSLFKEEYFLSTDKFTEAIEKQSYDAIIVFVEFESSPKEAFFQQLKEREKDSRVIVIFGRKRLRPIQPRIKYMAEFNGQPRVLDMEDICFLESYDRKTSVVIGKRKIRIKARLNIEEQKLSDDQFVRINRYNLINMDYIRNIEGDEIYMANGDNLYVSGNRRKVFMEKYSKFARENYRVI